MKIQRRVVDKTNFTYGGIIGLLEKVTGLVKLKKALDLGCGVGTLDFYLGKLGYFVMAIDHSHKKIDLAKKNAKLLKLKNIYFFCDDVEKVHVKDKFGLIICSEVIEHIKNDSKLLKKIAELLASSGILFLTAPLKSAPLNLLKLTSDFDKNVGHLRRYDTPYLTEMIEGNGLKVVNLSYGEGILRNSLFVFKLLNWVVRIANRSRFVSVCLTYLDNFFIRLLGPSNIYLIVRKP